LNILHLYVKLLFLCAWEGEISLCVKVFTCEIADFLKALKKCI